MAFAQLPRWQSQEWKNVADMPQMPGKLVNLCKDTTIILRKAVY